MIECICIDDTNKPAEIPGKKWVRHGRVYHITYIAFCLPQKVLAYSLYEKPLDETCKPHEYFNAARFAIAEDQIPEFLELCKSCRELDGLNIADLLKF